MRDSLTDVPDVIMSTECMKSFITVVLMVLQTAIYKDFIEALEHCQKTDLQVSGSDVKKAFNVIPPRKENLRWNCRTPMKYNEIQCFLFQKCVI